MNQAIRSTPIQSRALLVALATPAMALGLFLLVSIRLFGGDRIAEIFDSSRTVSSALAGQVRSELGSWQEQMRLFAGDVDPARGVPGEFARQLIQRSERLDSVWLGGAGRAGVADGSASGTEGWTNYRKGGWMSLNAEPLLEAFPPLLHGAAADGFAFKIVNLESDERFACHALALCKPVALAAIAAPAQRYVVALIDAEALLRVFSDAGAHKAYLVNPLGLAILSSDPLAEDAATDFSSWAFFGKLRLGRFHEGAEETTSAGQELVLVSYAPVGVGGLSVISVTHKAAALRAMRVPLWKSALWCLALLSVLAMAGVFTARWVAGVPNT